MDKDKLVDVNSLISNDQSSEVDVNYLIAPDSKKKESSEPSVSSGAPSSESSLSGSELSLLPKAEGVISAPLGGASQIQKKPEAVTPEAKVQLAANLSRNAIVKNSIELNKISNRKTLEDAVNKNPDDVIAKSKLASTLSSDGKYASAMSLYAGMIAENPVQPENYYGMYYNLVSSGRNKEAQQYLDKYNELKAQEGNEGDKSLQQQEEEYLKPYQDRMNAAAEAIQAMPLLSTAKQVTESLSSAIDTEKEAFEAPAGSLRRNLKAIEGGMQAFIGLSAGTPAGLMFFEGLNAAKISGVPEEVTNALMSPVTTVLNQAGVEVDPKSNMGSVVSFANLVGAGIIMHRLGKPLSDLSSTKIDWAKGKEDILNNPPTASEVLATAQNLGNPKAADAQIQVDNITNDIKNNPELEPILKDQLLSKTEALNSAQQEGIINNDVVGRLDEIPSEIEALNAKKENLTETGKGAIDEQIGSLVEEKKSLESKLPPDKSTVELPSQMAGGLPRKMVLENGEWKQQVGRETSVVSKAIQDTAQKAFEAAQKPKSNKLFAEPAPEIAGIVSKYKAENGIETPPGEKITSLDENQSKKIADAYDEMKHDPRNPEVVAAYDAMAKETIAQHKSLSDAGYTFELYEAPEGAPYEPYASSAEMLKDLRENKHLYVLPTEKEFGGNPITDEQRAENPLLKDSGIKDKNGKTMLINDVFRGVHDAIGHGERGNSFGAKGEENAWDVHSRMYTPLARRAMTSETRGQNSWVNFGKHLRDEQGNIKKVSAKEKPFAEQKIGLLPEWASELPEEKKTKAAQQERQELVNTYKEHGVSPSEQAIDNIIKTHGGNVRAAIDDAKRNYSEVVNTNQARDHNEHDGSTFLNGKNVSGKPFVSVSMFPERTKTIDSKTLTKEDIIKFKEENNDLLSGNEDVLAVGTWFDESIGKSVLDVVAVLPKDKIKQAERLGKTYNQKAAWDLEEHKVIGTGGTGEPVKGLKSEVERVEDVRSGEVEAKPEIKPENKVENKPEIKETPFQKKKREIAEKKTKKAGKPEVVTPENVESVKKEEYTPEEQKIVSGAQNVVKSINKLVDKTTGNKVSVTIHKNGESWKKAIEEAGGSKQDLKAKGFWMSDKGEIHINLENATSETIMHEGFHPVLDALAKNNPKIIDDLYKQLKGIEGGKDIASNAAVTYEGSTTIKKEAITDYIAKVADGSIKLDKTQFGFVKDWFNKLLKAIGLDAFTPELRDIKDLKQLAQVISEKFAKGEEIDLEAKVEKVKPQFQNDKNISEEPMYHGYNYDRTDGEDYEIPNGDRGLGWFTNDKKYAEGYTSGNGRVLTKYLNIKNPFVLSISPELKITPEDFIKQTGVKFDFPYQFSGKKVAVWELYDQNKTNFIDVLQDRGYDGLQTVEYGKHKSFMPFDESQILEKKPQFQAESLLTSKDHPVFKNLTDVARYIRKWSKENKLVKGDLAKKKDSVIVDTLSDHLKKELNAWESVNDGYKGFYDEDIPQNLNPELVKYAKDKYGKDLTDEEISLFHILSGFSSPMNSPHGDSLAGIKIFDKYLKTGKINPFSDKQATVWKRENGKIIDTGEKRFDEQGNPKMAKHTTAFSMDSFDKFKMVLNHFNGDLKKTVNWLESQHSFKELSDVSGAKLSEHENLTKADGGFGIFSITGAKLGSYILNRVGEFSTVTKDLWYARTMARLFGTPLVENGVALKRPFETTKEGIRLRKLSDEAFKKVGDELGVSPAIVQQRIWDFERKLWENMGGDKLSSGKSATTGLLKGIEDINKADEIDAAAEYFKGTSYEELRTAEPQFSKGKKHPLHKDMVDAARLAHEEGIKTVEQFAKEMDEKVGDVKEAWEEANGKEKYEDPEMTKMANAINDAYVEGKFGTDVVSEVMSQLKGTDMEEFYNKVKPKLENGEIDPETVRDRVARNEHGSAEDQAVLLYDMARLKGREALLTSNIKSADGKAKIEFQNELLKVQDEMRDNFLANKMIGRDWHNIGKLRQVWVDKSANLAEMENQYMASKGIKQLTEEHRTEIKKAYDKIRGLEDAVKRAKEDVRRSQKAVEQYAKERNKFQKQNEILSDLNDRLKEQRVADRGRRPSEAKEQSKARVEVYKSKLRELLGKPDTTKEAVQFSTEEPASEMATRPVEKDVASLISKIAMEKIYESGEKTSYDEIVNATLDEVKEVDPTFNKKDIQEHLAYNRESKSRNENSMISSLIKKIAKTKEQTETGDFKKVKKTAQEKSQKVRDLEDEYAKERFKWDKARREDLMENRPLGEKVWDNVQAWVRFTALTYTSTLLKLAAVVGHGLILKPLRFGIQAADYALLKSLGGKNIVEKQAIFGKPHLRSLGAYYSAFFKNFALKNLDDQFRGIDVHEVKYGKPYIYDDWRMGKGFLEMPGRSHGYIKSFIKNPEFAYANEQLSIRYMERYAETVKALENPDLTAEQRAALEERKKAVDPTTDENQEIIGQLSTAHGKWSILMNDNKFVEHFKRFLNDYNVGSQLLKSEFPIVKIPTNYIGRAFVTKFGLVQALTGKSGKYFMDGHKGLINLMINGTKDLSEKEADLLGRTINQGTMGAALGVLGFMAYKHIKEKEDGSLEVMGVHIPKVAAHIPEYETIISMAEARKHIKDDHKAFSFIKNYAEAEMDLSTNTDIVSKSPFVSALEYGFIGHIVDAMTTKDEDKKETKIIRALSKRLSDFITAGIVKETAKATDVRKKGIIGELTDQKKYDPSGTEYKRTPKGNNWKIFLESIEEGIPGLRKEVPRSEKP